MATLSFTVKNQAMQVCNLQTQPMSKVLKQSTLNQLQDSRNLAFGRGVILFCQHFRWAAYFDKLETKDSHIS